MLSATDLPSLSCIWRSSHGGGLLLKTRAVCSISHACQVCISSLRVSHPKELCLAITILVPCVLPYAHIHSFIHSVVPTCHSLQTAQPQQTISKPVTREGIGLHSGERATLRLLPAGAGEGRYFVQLPKEANKEAVIVPATVKNVTNTRLSTCLGKNRASVYTVEHLMSALEGLGVDNCRIEIDGANEVIIMYMHASFRGVNFLIPVAAVMILEATEQCGRMIFERIR